MLSSAFQYLYCSSASFVAIFKLLIAIIHIVLNRLQGI